MRRGTAAPTFLQGTGVRRIDDMSGEAVLPGRQALRLRTRADHDAVDRAFGRFGLADADGYGRFLLAQAAAVPAVEDALDRAGAARVVADWDERRRGHLLAADLADLGLRPEPAAPLELVAGDGGMLHEEVLGAIYVLEGSRLGGAVLARSVDAALPCRFLRAGNSARWQALVGQIDRELAAPAQQDAAVIAARRVFACFAAGASAVVEGH